MDVLAERAPQEFPHPVNHAVQVDRTRHRGLFASERQELLREVGGVLRRAHDLLDVGSQRTVRFQLVEHELAEPENGREVVVEIVGNAACQASEGFHLLRLAQLLLAVQQRLLGCAPCRDIAHVQQNGRRAFVGQAAGPDLDRYGPPVLRQARPFVVREFAGRPLREITPYRVTRLGRHHVDDVLSDQLLPFRPVEATGRRVDVQHVSVVVLDEDRVGRMVEEDAKLFRTGRTVGPGRRRRVVLHGPSGVLR